jgi:hypothetical protein
MILPVLTCSHELIFNENIRLSRCVCGGCRGVSRGPGVTDVFDELPCCRITHGCRWRDRQEGTNNHR